MITPTFSKSNSIIPVTLMTHLCKTFITDGDDGIIAKAYESDVRDAGITGIYNAADI